MLFAVVFVLLAFVLILFLWGGSMVMQGWWYESPAERLPLRAAVAGSLLALFLTLWCMLDARSGGGKYDTLFEFTPVESTDYDAFDCIMKRSNGQEAPPVHYQKQPGSKGTTTDFIDANRQAWKRNTSDSMAVAILIQEKDKAEPTRFDANLEPQKNAKGEVQKDPEGKPVLGFPPESVGLRFIDSSGRYMTVDSLGRVYRRKTGVLYANLALNAIHFFLWWLVLWLAMRFSVWHAFSLAVALWFFTMVAVQPVLFNKTRPQESGVAAVGHLDPKQYRRYPTSGCRSGRWKSPATRRPSL